MDKLYLHKIRKGDEHAQRLLYYEYADHLMSIISRYVNQVADREELLHDIFIKICDKISNYDEHKGSFQQWISRIAINHSINYLKKRKMVVVELNDINHLRSTWNEGIENLSIEDIHKVIDSLDEKYKAVFKLRALDGLDYDEIAKLLDSKVSGIRKIFSRARNKIQAQLSTEQYPLSKANNFNN